MIDKLSFERVGRHILVVEDDPAHMELIVEAMVEAESMNTVYCVGDGLEALRYIQRECQYCDEVMYPMPDLVILDLRLPGMNGKEVLRHLKSNERTRMIPVVMLTSSTRYEDIEECYLLGANSFITKPINLAEFVEVVRSIPSYWILVNRLPGGLIPRERPDKGLDRDPLIAKEERKWKVKS